MRKTLSMRDTLRGTVCRVELLTDFGTSSAVMKSRAG